MIEERIIELEIKLAYQEDLLQQLNLAVAKQQKQIGQLEQTLLLLHERLKTLSFSESFNSADNQPPPHY